MQLPQPVFSLSVILVTTGVSLLAWKKSNLLERMLFSTGEIIDNRDYLRLISSIFIHANIPHLLFNMFSFYSFAEGIEVQFGYKIIAYIYFYSAIGGSLLSLIMNRKNREYRALGASGAVCGIIFASIFLLPGGSVYIFLIPFPVPVWAYAILFVVISIYGIGSQRGRIGHDAHLGGALTGIIIVLTIKPEALFENYLLLAIILIPIIIFFIFKNEIESLLKQ